MENWKKCRFGFQTCLHLNQDYSETIKDNYLFEKKTGQLENSISQNRPVPKSAPPPAPGGPQKKIEKKCARILPVTV